MHLLPAGQARRSSLCLVLLTRTEGRFRSCSWGHRRGIRAGCARILRLCNRCFRLINGQPAATEHGIQGRTGILQEVKAVGNLHGVWGPGCGSLGIRFGPIARDNGNPWMLFEPGGEGVCIPSLDEINRPVRFQIDHQGRVGVATAQGQVVDAKDLWRRGLWHGETTDQAQHRIGTGRNTSTS